MMMGCPLSAMLQILRAEMTMRMAVVRAMLLQALGMHQILLILLRR